MLLITITVVILLACVILGFFVLVQNPKGGGLSGSFGSVGNQVMGVQRSGDVMEKGTWVLMAVIAGLTLMSAFFMPKGGTVESAADKAFKGVKAPTAAPAAAPAQQQPGQAQPQQGQQQPAPQPQPQQAPAQ
jgi:preprotein translocase subunit SecG